MNLRSAHLLLGSALASVLVTVPVPGHDQTTAAVTHVPALAEAPIAEVDQAPPAAWPDDGNVFSPTSFGSFYPPEPDRRKLLSPLEGLPDGPANETGPSVQSNDPYQRFQFAIYAQSPVGELTNPVGLALGPDGSVSVADSNDNRIQHFGATGALLNAWGALGSGEGQFSYPTGISEAAAGTVYVAGSRNDRVQRSTGRAPSMLAAERSRLRWALPENVRLCCSLVYARQPELRTR